MRIEQGTALDFCDVLLKPKRSTIESRKQIGLCRTFNFRHSDLTWSGVPIISSNMTSVTTSSVIVQMQNRNMLSCLPKNMEFDFALGKNQVPSVGLQENIPAPTPWLCLDVPNGYIEAVVDRTKYIRDKFQDQLILIVGNVVTAEMTEALILAGADIVKVGIGSGAACSTRIKTGVGMPQLSAVIECSDAAHGLGGHVVSDGGCSTPGDIVKGFAGGADFVMLGGMLAGHDENGTQCQNCNGIGPNGIRNPGRIYSGEWDEFHDCPDCKGTGIVHDFYGMSSERGNNEISNGLRNYRASEGWEIRLPSRGSIYNTLQDIEGGLRSACSYVGAKTLKDLPKCATFVQVNRQANNSLLEYRK